MEIAFSNEVINMIFRNPMKLKAYIHNNEVDMRKSWEGLIGIIQNTMNLDPLEESLFVFIGKSHKLVKILYWDGNGFCIWMKKLHKGTFPFGKRINMKINRRELSWLLSGVDMRRVHKVINK
jgi:transposase